MAKSHCCTSGVLHEGTPTGTFEVIAGVKTYVALPSGEYDKTKALIFASDAFGIELVNNLLTADSFAKNGIPTYIPDLFNGDGLKVEKMNDPTFNFFSDWLVHHPHDENRKPFEAVIKELSTKGVTKFAGTGYCMGALYVVDLILEGTITLGVVSHPNFLKVPEDLEALKKTRVPILFNTGEHDTQFPPASQAIADEVFKGDAFYKRTYWPGCYHGWSIRGDVSKPEVKEGKERTFDASVKWIQEHF